MTRRYKDLHKYQIRMIDWILANEKCALWAGVGLGKTVTTLTALSHLKQQNKIKKTLVIAPLRVVKFVWPKEPEEWDHLDELTTTVLHGTKRERTRLLRENTDIHIINKEMVQWLVDVHAEKGIWPYDCVVIDESTCMKNPRSKRVKSLRRARHHIKRMIQLTGTPAPNGLLDVWSQIQLLDAGERLGRTFTRYKETYFNSDYMGYTFTPKPGAKEQVYEKIQDLCLTMTAEDYLELPPCNQNVIQIDMDESFKGRYKELEDEFVLILEDEMVMASHAAVLSNKLLQFCGGAVYTTPEGEIDFHSTHPNKEWKQVSTLKLEVLEEMVEEMSGEPLMVAYNYQHELERLQTHFKDGKVLHTQGDVDAWNRGQIPLLFVHPASCGHGLNLQYGGANLVWFGLTWDLELYDQMNGRLDRQGQKAPVFIHHLVMKDSIEERVMLRLQNKALTQRELLEAMKKDV
jgi:SNF2 family DNA or RNA helicase